MPTTASTDPRPMLLRNPYGADMGTSGLIIQAQSREEILADKLLALALRPNRIKNRDLWDIAWLRQRDVMLPLDLIPKKLADRRRSQAEFLTQLEDRRRQVRLGHFLRHDCGDVFDQWLAFGHRARSAGGRVDGRAQPAVNVAERVAR